jgi:hypothetical protein
VSGDSLESLIHKQVFVIGARQTAPRSIATNIRKSSTKPLGIVRLKCFDKTWCMNCSLFLPKKLFIVGLFSTLRAAKAAPRLRSTQLTVRSTLSFYPTFAPSVAAAS